MKNEIKVEPLPPHIDGELIEQRAKAETVAKPFPLDLLPRVVQKYVKEGAEACGADPSVIALPTLVTLAACIGTTRKIAAKRTWTAPAILWGAVVGNSGTLKSCGYDLSRDLLSKDEERYQSEHEEAMKRYRIEHAKYKRAQTKWSRGKTDSEPPSEPAMPSAHRFIVDDQTLESLAPVMRENPRGLFQLTDELRGFFDGMGAYSSGGKSGKDESRWLSVFDARPFIVDRKQNRERISVPMTGVSVSGTIQPSILANTFSPNRIASGMLARLLLVMPEPRAKKWTDKEMSLQTRNAMRRVVVQLKELEHQIVDGAPQPIVLKMSRLAKKRFAEFVDSHGAETIQHEEALAAAWAKFEGYAMRFALVDHLVRAACGEKHCRSDGPVRRKSIENGIELSRWFASETERIYATLNFAKLDDQREGPENRNATRLAEWIKSHGGSATIRDINRGPRRYRGSNKEALIREDCSVLVRDNLAEWKNSRSVSEIVLSPTDCDGDGTQDLPEKTKQVSPKSPEGSKSSSAQETHQPRRKKKRRKPLEASSVNQSEETADSAVEKADGKRRHTQKKSSKKRPPRRRRPPTE